MQRVRDREEWKYEGNVVNRGLELIGKHLGMLSSRNRRHLNTSRQYGSTCLITDAIRCLVRLNRNDRNQVTTQS